MATIIEQLEGKSVTDTLKTSPSEAEWPKLGWSNTRGTFSASGWKPPGYNEWAPTHSYGGTYKTTEVTGGNGYVFLNIPVTYGLINSPYRSFSVWLFSGGGTAKPNGYQLRLQQASSGSGTPHKYIFALYKWVEETETLIAESGEVTIETGGAFALACVEGKLTMYLRETEGGEWVQVGSEYSDATFTEGYSAIDGTGSNPTLADFSTGTLEASEKIEEEHLSGEKLESVSVPSPATIEEQSEWKVFLAKSSDLSNIADLTTVARDKSLSIALNKSGSMSFNLPLDTEIVEEIDVVNRCIKAVKNDQVVWSGPIWTLEENLPENKLSVNASGWFELLRKRFHLKDTSVYSLTNMGTLMFNNLTIANEQQASWITEGTNSATGVVTRQWKRFDNIGDAIEGLSQIENGPDFRVDPVTRKLIIEQQNMTDRPNVLFGYNYGPSNIASLKRSTDADVMANYIVASGANNQAVAASAVEQQEKYRLFQRIDSLNSVANATILTAYANAEIVLCANPRVIYSFTPFPSSQSDSSVPSIFEDYDIGDKVYLSAKWAPRFDVNKQAVRVFGTSIQIDSEGNEKVGEIQTTFSS